MTLYTVVWHFDAQDQLAEIWLASSSRNAVTQAAHRIDTILGTNPDSKSRPIADNLRKLTVAPLQVLFAVSESDRIVKIIDVATN